eukprot:9082878-Alexandrium_andersonii.AAC.1
MARTPTCTPIRIATAPHFPSANIENGPTFQMGETTAPRGPQGETFSSNACNRRESGTLMFRC